MNWYVRGKIGAVVWFVAALFLSQYMTGDAALILGAIAGVLVASILRPKPRSVEQVFREEMARGLAERGLEPKLAAPPETHAPQDLVRPTEPQAPPHPDVQWTERRYSLGEWKKRQQQKQDARRKGKGD